MVEKASGEDGIKSITELIGLLGKKNVERLQDRIVDLICARVEDDLDDFDEYIFCPGYFEDFFSDCAEAAKKKAKKQITEKIQNKLLDATGKVMTV